ncbi:MAG: GyrI-like domain-containing protein [Anaerolineae bacterium]|nr:GyrI-like domain-containing protein [Anaerolineae bacterium]
MSSTKLDFKTSLKALYSPPADEFVLVDVPPLNYLMIDGAGDPNTATGYKLALEALFALSYTIKFAVKKSQGIDYAVMPPEGLWWAGDERAFTTERNKDEWSWTMMIMQPEFVTAEIVNAAIDEVRAKKNPARLADIRFETYHEGLSLQKLHLGSYDDETPTLIRLHREFIPQNGYIESGKHHEIYLNDPQRTAPAKLRTVLRQPVRRV